MINQIIFSFIMYFAVLVGIGLFFYSRSKNAGSFLVANRSLNYWVTAIAAQSSDMGSWLFLGYPAVVFLHGSIKIWVAVGLVIFMYLNWLLIAAKLRTATERYRSFTLPTFFERRFDDASGVLRMLSAIVALFFFLLYLAAGLVGLGTLFESVFHISYYTGILIGTAITVAYILIGGFFAVAWCNLFQGIFLMVMIVTVPLYALHIMGGANSIYTQATIQGISLHFIPTDISSLLLILFNIASFGLGYFGQPHILVNFMSIDNVDNVKNATRVGITWQILVLAAASAIGLIGIGYFQHGINNPEHIFVQMTTDLFPPLLAGFVLCAILAAALSTINTQLLVAAGNFAEDIYPKFAHRTITSHHLVNVSRGATVIIALLAMLIAYNIRSTIYDLVLYAWSGLGSAFGPLVIAALYYKQPTRQGAIAGLITGSCIGLMWPFFNTSIPTLVPGLGISMVVIIAVSMITGTNQR